MNFNIRILSLFLFMLTSAFQTAKVPSFKMDQPENWYLMPNQQVLDNLGNLKLSPVEMDRFLSDHKGSVEIFTYIKYKPEGQSGLIPTIKVNLRKSPKVTSFNQFFESIVKNASMMKTILRDFEFIREPDSLLIDNRKAVFFSATFTLETEHGELFTSRSRTYAIPIDGQFYQVNFMDGEGEKDCTALYDSLVQTIKIDN